VSSAEELIRTATAWLAEDPDPETRAELSSLLDAGDIAAIADRFAGRLQFGTAGLRGALGAGPNRMNRAVVRRAAAGLAAYLRSHGADSLGAHKDSSGEGDRRLEAVDPGTLAVVVGFDARHKSDLFARDTAAVVTGAGLHAMVLPRPLPTPVLAYAIRHLGADAGVMVTASHNPPQDNGYKVYLGDGSQIVPPADVEISSAIDAVGSLNSLPLGDDWETLDNEVLESYIARASAVVAPGGPRDLRVAYTPLHGTGWDVVRAAFTQAGFAEPLAVKEQAEPDPDFPTVAFPNPEEPGAMDLACALAEESGADLVIANDPDADRCAVGVADDGSGAGGWRTLRGDEVGALIATHLVRTRPRLTGTFATTIVSSSLLGKIAAAHGLAYAETLTGFKWLSRVPNLVYGYEEALGYCVDPTAVRDKDGITAALLVCELAASLKAAGRTLTDLLDEIAREYDLHETRQLSLRVSDLSQIDEALAQLRASPPPALGGRAVTSADDLSTGIDGLPAAEGVRYRLRGGARVVVRPSGTEPKLKCYLEVVEPVPDGDVDAARARADGTLAAIRADLAVATGTA
jgi:phosphomannomutase